MKAKKIAVYIDTHKVYISERSEGNEMRDIAIEIDGKIIWRKR